MSDLPAIRRQLKIKAGVAQRLMREHNLYREELTELQRKLDKYKAEGGDHWEVGNATRVLDEGKRMVIDSETRFGKAVEDLRGILASARKESELAADKDLLKAEEVLEEASV